MCIQIGVNAGTAGQDLQAAHDAKHAPGSICLELARDRSEATDKRSQAACCNSNVFHFTSPMQGCVAMSNILDWSQLYRPPSTSLFRVKTSHKCFEAYNVNLMQASSHAFTFGIFGIYMPQAL